MQQKKLIKKPNSIDKFVISSNLLIGFGSNAKGIENLTHYLTNPTYLTIGTGIVAYFVSKDVKESIKYSALTYVSYLGGETILQGLHYFMK